MFFGFRVHYFAYPDEFGHIGPFLSRSDPRHHTSPVFGFAGIVLPVTEVRKFSMYFYKLKCRLLEWEISRDQKNTPAYQWEKKGSALYSLQNVEKYSQLRHATFRLMNKIESIGGFVFYSGIEKDPPLDEHTPEALYTSVLRDCIRRLDRYCNNNTSTFSILLDAIDSMEPGAKRKFRLAGISAAGSEMFRYHHGNPCAALLEPPYQLESHLYQNLQCADWFCGLLNKYLMYQVLPEQYADYKMMETYFGARLQRVLKAGSLRRKKPPTPEENIRPEEYAPSLQPPSSEG
ncbi:DUF3800 domain-containing protein [Mailhella massiliensis]|uniref:DUF3800 domain-containing protein n=1 Tax=Mailhella massiliensis TaxID=1903261 RepID=A0A921AU93_9BACT|nr:DUF3800 domain-containing protein [Mailhella massiliensis]HJD96025.1 DUF3800 domain-containing protein [Mailhella massiliensis]